MRPPSGGVPPSRTTTSPISSYATPSNLPRRDRLQQAVRRRLAGRHLGHLPGRGGRGRPWSGGVRRRPGHRVGLMSKTRYEWTSARLRDLVRRRGHGPDLRDLGSPSRSQWILADSGARGLSSSRPPSTWPRSRRSRDPLPALRRRLVHRPTATVDRARHARRATVPRRRARATRRATRDRRLPRHAHLHLGHHRAAQGLRADPRQLPRPGRATPARRSGRRRPPPGRVARCCSCRWRTSSPGSSRCSASTPGRGSATAADVKNLLDDLGGLPADLRARRAAGVREGLQLRRGRRPTADGKGRIFARRGGRGDRVQPGARTPAARRWLLRVQHALFDRLVYGKLRDALGGQVQYAVSGGAPLGRRGSATSSAASASPSSRATG